MDDTRSDDLIRRNHELLAAAAKAWSDFMETVARIDHVRAQERMRRALWYRSREAIPSRPRSRLERED
jgi:ribosomal protein L31E